MKVHSRRKRLLSLKTGHKHKFFFHKVIAKVRPKTFGTKEAAGNYAKDNGFKEFDIVPAKKTRFKLELR